MKKGRREGPEIPAIEEVCAIYRDLAARPVERSCTLRTECCQFNITGRVPYLTRGEALLVAHGWRATGRKKLPTRDDGTCPMLDEKTGRCLVYEYRPFGCRTHFCAPAGGPCDRKSVIDLIHRLEAVDASLAGIGARPIEAAVSEALAKTR